MNKEYPNCDCDLVGGDADCKILPPYQTREQELVELLLEARSLGNQTVKSSIRVDRWHRAVDAALKGVVGDKAEDRYDYPIRAEARDFVNRLFERRSK